MTTKLTPEAVDLLLTCCELGRWHVAEQTICPIAELLQRQYIITAGDYDSIGIFPTDKGRRYALQQGWLASAPSALTGEPWERTTMGHAAANYITDRP